MREIWCATVAEGRGQVCWDVPVARGGSTFSCTLPRCACAYGDDKAEVVGARAGSWGRNVREGKQNRRCLALQEEVSPKMDPRQLSASASCLAQRIPDSHGGSNSPVLLSS